MKGGVVLLVAMLGAAGCAESTPAARGPVGPMQPAESGDLHHLCSDARPCHPATHVRLTMKDGTAFETDVPPAPYILGNNVVRVLPGDDFFFAGEEQEGVIVSLRYIEPPPADQKNVIRVQFEQSVIDGHPVMLMHIRSTFDKPVMYHATLHRAGWQPGQFVKTSTCPLSPGIPVTEMWPDPISALMLFHFRVTADAGSCRYY